MDWRLHGVPRRGRNDPSLVAVRRHFAHIALRYGLTHRMKKGCGAARQRNVSETTINRAVKDARSISDFFFDWDDISDHFLRLGRLAEHIE
jgi:hypothetical protein